MMYFKMNALGPMVLTLLLMNAFSAPAQAQSGANGNSDEMSEQILKRDLGEGRIRILDIESNFVAPKTSTNYFARLYTSKKMPNTIEFRNVFNAEKHYDQEKILKSPIYFVSEPITEFAPPNGYDLVRAPGTQVNVTAHAGFDLNRGGVLELYIKAPFAEARNMVLFIDRRGDVLRTFLEQEDGSKVQFDQIFIEAKRLMGKANILRGIEGINFLFHGKTVAEI